MSDTLEESQPAHAPLGPSSAEGWSTCADYVNANRGLPDSTTEPAAEGTAAHLISEVCLLLGIDAEELLGMPTQVAGHMFAWEEDDAELLQIGLDEIRDEIGDGQFWGEQRVDISPWTLPGQFGTLDRAYVLPDEIVIRDLKWGRGVPVSPVENKQLMLYALGFWASIGRPDIQRFRLVIDQPRHAGGGGVWNTTLDELLRFGDWIKERAVATARPGAPRTASLQGCMWCRRRRVPGVYGGCNTYDAYMVALLGATWDNIDMGILMDTELALSAPRDLTPERRSYLLLHRDAIKRWLDQLSEETMADALAGSDTGLVKAVEGNKAPDRWSEKGVAARPVVERLLGEKGFNKMLKSPKQVATAVEGDAEASKEVAQHVTRGQRKPILVPLADARRPITTGSAFEEE